MKYKYGKEKIAAYTRESLNSQIVCKMKRNEWKATLEAKEIKKDSDIRREIHQTIINMLLDNKSKEEILSKLLADYPTFYLKDKFEKWIDDRISTYCRTRKKNEDEGKEIDE